jgi:hypothetical protein
VQAERVVAAVAAAYYGAGVRGAREGLRPLVEVIERAAPGVIELSSAPDRPGFEIKLVGRPFPERCEPDLRSAAVAVLGAWNAAPGEEAGKHDVGAQHAVPLHANTPLHRAVPDHPGWISRLVRAVRRLFSGSA